MKIIFIFFAFLFFLDPVLLAFNPILFSKCEKNGICRNECHTSEMLVAYCKNSLECCVLGNPQP
ncbi:beta-defensin 134 [Dromiciops gliroides]|uniref:beta-defensin 134 n=1 Tax=Dromiciops gliroides TaxID=33562 RepID=UPI001CC59B29|nr:beta-defensin 134 [Dromiciops gliroides]